MESIGSSGQYMRMSECCSSHLAWPEFVTIIFIINSLYIFQINFDCSEVHTWREVQVYTWREVQVYTSDGGIYLKGSPSEVYTWRDVQVYTSDGGIYLKRSPGIYLWWRYIPEEKSRYIPLMEVYTWRDVQVYTSDGGIYLVNELQS